AVRLLHARADPVRDCVAVGAPAIDRGDPRRHERQPVPLRGACQHHRSDCRGRRPMSGPAFRYVRATGLDAAVAAGGKRGASYLAGGTDLLQLWKSGLATPRDVIDISRLPLADIVRDGDTFVIGALARMSDVAAHPEVNTHLP